LGIEPEPPAHMSELSLPVVNVSAVFIVVIVVVG